MIAIKVNNKVLITAVLVLFLISLFVVVAYAQLWECGCDSNGDWQVDYWSGNCGNDKTILCTIGSRQRPTTSQEPTVPKSPQLPTTPVAPPAPPCDETITPTNPSCEAKTVREGDRCYEQMGDCSRRQVSCRTGGGDGSSDNSPGIVAGDEPPPWGTPCAMGINRCISRRAKMFADQCLGPKCTRFDSTCILNRIKRLRFCTDWRNTYAKFPEPKTCNLADICKPPLGMTLDYWLQAMPPAGSPDWLKLPSLTTRCICEQYLQLANNNGGDVSALGCTQAQVEGELARYYPQCRKERPKTN